MKFAEAKVVVGQQVDGGAVLALVTGAPRMTEPVHPPRWSIDRTRRRAGKIRPDLPARQHTVTTILAALGDTHALRTVVESQA